MTKVSIEYVLAVCFTVFGLVVFAVATWLANRWRRAVADRRDYMYDIDRKMTIAASIAAPLALLVVLAAFIGGAWPPFDMEYHSYRQVHGTVADVQARFLGDSRSTSQLYVVRLAGSDQVYRCDDSRCALVKAGDELWLWCIREWQQASTPGYDCNFGDSRRTP